MQEQQKVKVFIPNCLKQDRATNAAVNSFNEKFNGVIVDTVERDEQALCITKVLINNPSVLENELNKLDKNRFTILPLNWFNDSIRHSRLQPIPTSVTINNVTINNKGQISDHNHDDQDDDSDDDDDEEDNNDDDNDLSYNPNNFNRKRERERKGKSKIVKFVEKKPFSLREQLCYLLLYSKGGLSVNKWEDISRSAKKVLGDNSREGSKIKDLFRNYEKKGKGQINCEKIAEEIIHAFCFKFIQSDRIGDNLQQNIGYLHFVFKEYGSFESDFLSVCRNEIVVDSKFLGNLALSKKIRKFLLSEINQSLIKPEIEREPKRQRITGTGKRNPNYTLWEQLVYVSLFIQLSKTDWNKLESKAKALDPPLSRTAQQLQDFFKNQKLTPKLTKTSTDRTNSCTTLADLLVKRFVEKYRSYYSDDIEDKNNTVSDANNVFKTYGGFQQKLFLLREGEITITDLQLPDDRIKNIFLNCLKNEF